MANVQLFSVDRSKQTMKKQCSAFTRYVHVQLTDCELSGSTGLAVYIQV